MNKTNNASHTIRLGNVEVTFRPNGDGMVLVLTMAGFGTVRGPRVTSSLTMATELARTEWRRLISEGFAPLAQQLAA